MARYKGKHTRAKKQEAKHSARGSSSSGRYKKKKTSQRKVGIIAICIAIVAIVAALLAGYVYFSNADLDGIILENITVAGVDVGGMSQRDAIEAVSAATADTYGSKAMTVTVLDSQVQLPASCCRSLNVRSAVRAAYKFGHSGTESKRQEQQQIAMTSGYVVDITPYLDLDEKAIKDALKELGSKYSTTLTQSTYKVTGEAPNQTLVITLGVPEYGLNFDELYQQVLDAYSQNKFSVEGKCGMIEPSPVDLQGILDQYYIAPIETSFDKKTNKVVAGKDGYGFDLKAAQEKLKKAAYGSTVEIPFVALPPELTAKELEAMLYRDKLATYTAAFDSDPNRNTNLALACKAINGLILYPGDVFSFNEKIGQCTTARGYKSSVAFEGTDKVTGGGISQVSSSLYYCAMVADLEILMRTNHTYAPSFMPLGMDATVKWGSVDFRFKNNSDYPIRIEAAASEGSTSITILGTDTKDYSVKMEYEKLKTYDYDVTYQNKTAGNAEGYKNGDYIVEPFTGYDIKTYRCKYNKDTDELISKDLEASFSYQKRDGVICKIQGSSSGSASDSSGIGGGGISEGPGALPPE